MRNRRNHSRWRRWISCLLLGSMGAGCCHRADVSYLGDPKHNYYKGRATQVEFAAVDVPATAEVVNTAPPNTLWTQQEPEIREIHLTEAIQIALSNSDIMRTAGGFLTAGSVLGANDRTSTVYDPAIQESGVLFGGRGVEAALSAFDAQLQASMIWGRNETVQNNRFFSGGQEAGTTLVQETAAFQGSLSKTFAHGGAISLNHNVNYLGNNIGTQSQAFPSVYTGNVQLQYQLPLLAGAGTEFTRVAGPIGQAFGGLSGVSQGVLIARINNDISISDFEAAIRNQIKDVEDAYWDLYLAYRNFDTAVRTRDQTLEIWEKQRVRKEIGTRGRQDESQARDQYFALASAADNARSQLYTAETRFRRLIGLAAGDGTILRPADSPVTAEFLPEWYHCLTEALTERVELRRQKWNIKSLELQYKAAQSLVKPRLDFIGNYQVNGFGDDLIGYTDAQAYDNFYQSLTDGNQTGWNLGVQFRWDIGFRSQLAQVRNYELRLAKARRVLQEQEEEISHELAFAFQELSRSFNSAEQNQNRVFAAQENVEVFRLQEQVGIDVPQGGESIIDQRLRSETRLAQAQIAFHESLVAYQKALTDLQYRKGTLLEYNCIYLAEGGWKPEAYADAKRNAEARAHAIANPYLHTAPPAFSGPSPFGGVFFTHPENELGPAPGLLDSPEAMPIPANDSSPVDELPDGDHSGAEDSPSRETALIEQTSAERPNPVPPPRAAVPPIFNVGAGAVQWID